MHTMMGLPQRQPGMEVEACMSNREKLHTRFWLASTPKCKTSQGRHRNIVIHTNALSVLHALQNPPEEESNRTDYYAVRIDQRTLTAALSTTGWPLAVKRVRQHPLMEKQYMAVTRRRQRRHLSGRQAFPSSSERWRRRHTLSDICNAIYFSFLCKPL